MFRYFSCVCFPEMIFILIHILIIKWMYQFNCFVLFSFSKSIVAQISEPNEIGLFLIQLEFWALHYSFWISLETSLTSSHVQIQFHRFIVSSWLLVWHSDFRQHLIFQCSNKCYDWSSINIFLSIESFKIEL